MISTFGWICICFSLLIFKYVFLQPIENKRLYRLYEARDNVAFAAIEGKISQDAEEYKFVIKNINSMLFYMKNSYDFHILTNNILFRPEEAKQKFDSMIELIKGYDFLEKNYNISTAYFQRSLNVRIFFFIHFIITPFYCFLSILLIILKLGKRITDYKERITYSAERRVIIMQEMNAVYVSYRRGYAK